MRPPAKAGKKAQASLAWTWARSLRQVSGSVIGMRHALRGTVMRRGRGILRKGSFNRMVMNALPGLAPAGMSISEAPPFSAFPLYNADVQNSTGFPAPVTTLANAIRAADGVIFNTPEYNFSLPGGLKNALDWVSRLQNQPFAGKPIAIQSASPGLVGGARVQY